MSELNMQLIDAAGKLESERVRELLAQGADAGFLHKPEGVWGSSDSKSALHAVLMASRRDDSGGDKQAAWADIVAQLLEAGADVTTSRATARATRRQRLDDKQAAWADIVGQLLEAGADVNAKRSNYDWRGCGSTKTAFEMVLPAAMEDVQLLEQFLAAGADANTKTESSTHSMRTDGHSVHSVLQSAVRGRDLEVARALLDAGAEVDFVSESIYHNERGYNQHLEETALHIACSSGNLAMAALLMARGANIDAVRKNLEHVDSGVESLTDDPREEGYESPVRCVPVRETALHMAIQAGNADLVVMLVCGGADRTLKRVYDGAETSAEELCQGNGQLLEALKAEWTPERHHLFPPEVRESVGAAWAIARRQKWPIPDTVLFQALAMAAATGQAPPASS